MDKTINITDPSLAAALVAMGIPMMDFDKEKFIFIFRKTLDVQNIITLYTKTYLQIREDMEKIKSEKKVKKEDNSPFADLHKEYKISTKGIKGAPTSKSGGVYKQYLG